MALITASEKDETPPTIEQGAVDDFDRTPRQNLCYQACRTATKRAIDVPSSSNVAMIVQFLFVGLIVLSTLSVIVETCPGMENHRTEFSIWENIVTLMYTIETLVRYWISDSTCEYLSKCANILDIIATFPGYVEWFLATQNVDPFWRVRQKHLGAGWTLEMLRMLQVVRLMRILRLAKAARHSDFVSTVMLAFYASINGLGALIVFVGSSAVLSATVVFYTEAVDPDTKFVSIPASIWWSLATITGVGYGDMVPETITGKAAGAVTMIGGVLAISMSVAIITTAFMEEYRRSITLLKIERMKGGRKPGGDWRRASVGDLSSRASQAEFQPLAMPFQTWPPEVGRKSFLIDPENEHILSTLMTLEESTKEVLTRLDATILKIESTVPVKEGFGLQSTRHSFSSPALQMHKTGFHPTAGMKTALTLLREQNAAWFKHAASLAETILEGDVDGSDGE